MESNEPILELDAVTVEADPTYDSAVRNANVRLLAGELALVRLERGNARIPLADAAQGLVEPNEGTVRFHGREWRSWFPGSAAAQRGNIGRVFEGRGWVSNLDVDENVLLARRHHGGQPVAEVIEEADRLARAFGLPRLPHERPAAVRWQDLQRAACVRAFLGRPDLLILERPTHGVFPGILAALLEALQSARERGAAVLWLSSEPDVWQDANVRPTYRYVMTGEQMLQVPPDTEIPPHRRASDPGEAVNSRAARERAAGIDGSAKSAIPPPIVAREIIGDPRRAEGTP